MSELEGGGGRAGGQDAGGQQVQDVFAAVGDDGVAGVVAALRADHDIG